MTHTCSFTTDFPGKIVDWHGFCCHEFTIDGIQSRLVLPDSEPDKNKPWYYRVHFFGAFPDADFALLHRGWHVAHIEVNELYGNDECMRRMNMLYDFMVANGFSSKCAAVGYSRGGLDVYRWATLYPEKVSCLYLDNPVCDFKSWPGGKGSGPGEKTCWENCLKAWNFTEEEALAYQGNPVDTLEVIARHGIPVLHLCADADECVPAEENTAIVVERMKKLGGKIEVVWKPGGKHHPHCLSDPTPIVNFVLDNQ